LKEKKNNKTKPRESKIDENQLTLDVPFGML
jgi:hypothetical protein